LNDEWLAQNGIDLGRLNEGVVGEMSAKGVNVDFGQAAARRDIVTYLKAFRRDAQITIPHPPRDTLLISMLKDLFFNQGIRLLESGGFAGAYLFVDDIENIVDQPTRKYREIFAKELGFIQFRMDYDAGIKRFLTIVLTTHDNAANKLSEAWNLAGLSASLPMSIDAPNSIKVTSPTLEERTSPAILYSRFNTMQFSAYPIYQTTIHVGLWHEPTALSKLRKISPRLPALLLSLLKR